VAATVKQRDVTGGNLLEGIDHLFERQIVRGRIEIGVALRRHGRGFEDPDVIGPGGVAEPHGRAGVIGAQVIADQAQGTGAAGCVRRRGAPRSDDVVVGAEQQLLDGGNVVRCAVERAARTDARMGVLPCSSL
jgi:hypothetical protein